MSDDEFDMYASGDDDFIGESEQDDPTVELENLYYEAKEQMNSDPGEALATLGNIILIEQEKGSWGFKAVKSSIKLLNTLNRFDEMKEKFAELMTYTKKAVTTNQSEKAINNLLDLVAKAPNISEIYELVLNGLKDTNNQRVYLRLQLRMAKVLQEKKDYPKLARLLTELRESCLLADGSEDASKSSQLIEVLAFEIIMYTEQGNTRRLKEIYDKAKSIKSAINAPLITGIIHECGGKMYMMEKDWGQAYTEFFQAFKDYDEFGSPKAMTCLKYLVIANMLSSSDINPFEDPRAKAFQNKDETQIMMQLVSAYEKSEISSFNNIIRNNKATFEDDFLKQYMQQLLYNIRSRVLLQLIVSYSRISIAYIASELRFTQEAAEEMVVSLILDRKLKAAIDQIKQVVYLHQELTIYSVENKQKAIKKWSNQLENIQTALSSRLN
eukprot:TRINITY_DN1327_c0_g1_i1.p1 TRINITY_DN1327_c0_g1~~TRINITY_DN1327_c0_g1_i1.p1  ORF type:complete len:440 (-),score=208.05 TRINITY_DN1327_c0_g1_i1:152-1471(-)